MRSVVFICLWLAGSYPIAYLIASLARVEAPYVYSFAVALTPATAAGAAAVWGLLRHVTDYHRRVGAQREAAEFEEHYRAHHRERQAGMVSLVPPTGGELSPTDAHTGGELSEAET